MLQTQTCVVIHCDQCGDSPHGPQYEPHWPTESEALVAVSTQGWHVEGDGTRLLCPDCAPVLLCEAAGHEFTPWRRCRCEQLVPAHRPGPAGLCGMDFRYCARCCLHESRPAPTDRAVA